MPPPCAPRLGFAVGRCPGDSLAGPTSARHRDTPLPSCLSYLLGPLPTNLRSGSTQWERGITQLVGRITGLLITASQVPRSDLLAVHTGAQGRLRAPG